MMCSDYSSANWDAGRCQLVIVTHQDSVCRMRKLVTEEIFLPLIFEEL